MVMGDQARDRHFDGILLAFATELAAGEILRRRLHTGINGRMDGDFAGHVGQPPVRFCF